jgi:flagellar hook-length control protein FliK
MNGDQATATFTSANASVREALENAMPRLREILQGSGVSLGQTDVGAESSQQSAGRGENGDNPARGRGRDVDTAAPHGLALGENAPADWLRRGDGLVDTFA